MNEHHVSIETIITVAKALEEINKKVVYVGGATISLYVAESFRDSIRPTEDIDIVLEIATLSDLENLRIALSEKGIKQSFEDDVVCRFRYKEIKIDVMATREIAWAPANRWFEKGFQNLEHLKIDETTIQILSLPYFLATKFEAFNHRGKKDPRTSKDFEDIVFLLNNSRDLKEKVNQSDDVVKSFLKVSFKEMLESRATLEALRAHLSFENEDERFELIVSILKSVLK